MDRNGRNEFVFDNWKLRKIEENEYKKLSWFDCNDDDINEFFHEDAFLNKRELLTESYVYEFKGSPVALISIMNDCIHFDVDNEADDKKRKWMYRKLNIHPDK